MQRYIELIIGGSLGTIARYLMDGLVYRLIGTSFPYGTLVINISGCFLIGVLSKLSIDRFLLGSDTRTFLMIGFCGAYTTFSTFIFESNGLLADGEFFKALLNVVLSVVTGFLFFRIGVLLGELI